jgi:hypothetical protein
MCGALGNVRFVPFAYQSGQPLSPYSSEASWCVPMKNAPVAVPKGKGQSPSTMRQSGNYCIAPK